MYGDATRRHRQRGARAIGLREHRSVSILGGERGPGQCQWVTVVPVQRAEVEFVVSREIEGEPFPRAKAH